MVQLLWSVSRSEYDRWSESQPSLLEGRETHVLPIIASVGTTLAAFLPLMLWPGVTGQFMRYLPVTVFAVLAGSLLYALVFAPVLGGIIRPRAERRQDPLHGR